MIRPYRPAPHDFAETFVRMGWGREIEEHYRANYRCIARWVEQCGGEELRRARAEHCGYARWKSGYARHARRSERYQSTAQPA